MTEKKRTEWEIGDKVWAWRGVPRKGTIKGIRSSLGSLWFAIEFDGTTPNKEWVEDEVFKSKAELIKAEIKQLEWEIKDCRGFIESRKEDVAYWKKELKKEKGL